METRLGSRSITLRDRVKNLGARTRPFMVLYHINLGWPVVSEHSELLAAACEDEPRDEVSAADAERSREFGPAEAGYESRVYYRDLPAGPEGLARIAVVNRRLPAPLGVAISFGKKELPLVVEWKNLHANEYVVGIEPSNCRVWGRARERGAGTLRMIGPDETRQTQVTIDVLDTHEAIDEFTSSLPG